MISELIMKSLGREGLIFLWGATCKNDFRAAYRVASGRGKKTESRQGTKPGKAQRGKL